PILNSKSKSKNKLKIEFNSKFQIFEIRNRNQKFASMAHETKHDFWLKCTIDLARISLYVNKMKGVAINHKDIVSGSGTTQVDQNGLVYSLFVGGKRCQN
ncbi:unnamed protein product, partial [Rotaria magnacalcarata]